MKSCRYSRCATVFLALAIYAAGTPGLAANKKPPLTPINLNTATALELQQVPGIGPSTADKILKMRKSYGPFKSVDDLRAIKGIGPKRMEKMRKYVTVGKAASPKKIDRRRGNAIQFAVWRNAGAPRAGKDFESKSARIAIEQARAE